MPLPIDKTTSLATLAVEDNGVQRIPGVAAGNLLVLDGTGLVPVSNIPALAYDAVGAAAAAVATALLKASNLSDLGSASAARTNLGLGSAAVLSAAAFEAAITGGTVFQYWRGDKSWQVLSTANVPESGNLYYTNARASAAAPVQSVAGRTGAVVIARADVSGLGSAAALNADNTANNIPLLGGDGKLASAVLPSLAISEPFVVASQAAMLALTAQRGDIAIRTDSSKTYILSVDDPTTLSNWVELLGAGEAPVQTVAGRTGSVVLTKSDVGLSNVTNVAQEPVITAGSGTNVFWVGNKTWRGLIAGDIPSTLNATAISGLFQAAGTVRAYGPTFTGFAGNALTVFASDANQSLGTGGDGGVDGGAGGALTLKGGAGAQGNLVAGGVGGTVVIVPGNGGANFDTGTAASGQILLQGATIITGSASASGAFTAASFGGNGASLTSLNASNLSSGTVPYARLPTSTSGTSSTVPAFTSSVLSLSAPIATTKRLLSGVVSLGSISTTISTDASLGNQFNVTLTGNVTLANPTNAADGQGITWCLLQDGTGGRTVTLDTAFNDATLAISVMYKTASKREYISAVYNAASGKWDVMPHLGAAY